MNKPMVGREIAPGFVVHVAEDVQPETIEALKEMYYCLLKMIDQKENAMSNPNTNEEVKSWAIVELMGHKVVAGLIQKSEMLGKPLLRVDVPATSVFPEFTQFYGEAAIYCVTFVSEEVACLTAEHVKTNPVSIYVPELITKEQYEETVRKYREEIEKLRTPALAGSSRNDSSDGDEFDSEE